MVMFYAVMILCFSGSTLAQMVGWGPCPEVHPMPDFNIANATGEWYEAKRYFRFAEVLLKCVKSDIRQDGNGTVLLDGYATSRLTGKTGVITGLELITPDPAEPGKLKVKYPSMPVLIDNWVLGTDYSSYFISYSCIDWKMLNVKLLWISTRDQHPSEAVIAKAIEVIQKQNLPTKYLLTANQENCETSQNSTKLHNAEEMKNFY